MSAILATIGPWDITIIVLYIVGIVALGCWAGLRRRSQSQGSDYFLAGGTLTWPVIGLALFSTNISTVHLVSLAQEGYQNGLAYGNFEWMAAFILIALALFFAPFYIRSKVTTLPDFLEKRYSRQCRDWLAFMSIISAITIHIGFTLYTGAVVLEGLFGIQANAIVEIAGISINVRFLIIIAIACLTGLYTIIGGLLAVVLTESIQTIVLLAGAICITLIGLQKAGGWDGVAANVDAVKLTIIRPHGDPSGLPWYSVLLGYPVIGFWYWCADQTIVQRVLGAKDENHARLGPLFAGFIKILPVFIFVLPGTICLALINQGKLPAMTTADGGDTYSHLIKNLLPTGLSGLVAAALLAALMSTVSGALNSIATLFSYDIYKRWRPETPQKKLITIGRIVTFVGMIAAIFWSPLLSHYSSIFRGINTLIGFVAPPITAVFIVGVFWRGASAYGAQITLYVGSFLGAVAFFLDWTKDEPWMLWLGYKIPFMIMSFFLCVACILILVVFSQIKPHQHTPESEKLVWAHPLDSLKDPGWPGLGNYKLWAITLFVVMIVIYAIFR